LAFVTAANLNAVKCKHDHKSRGRLANADRIATAVAKTVRAIEKAAEDEAVAKAEGQMREKG